MTTILHVGGLGWSGSGAVLDALLDTGLFVSLKGKTTSVSESRLFSGRPPHPALVASTPGLSGLDITALWTAGSRVVDRPALDPRIRRTLDRTAGQHRINHKVFRTVEAEALHAAAERTAALVAAATDGPGRAAAYRRGTYAAMRSLLGADGSHVLIDNDPGVTPVIAHHLDADDHVLFVAVIRDPGDQYVDRRAKIEGDESVPLNLLRTLRAAMHRRRELRALAALAERRPDRLFIVAFERFVREADYRELLLARLVGTPDANASESPPRFVPERSARNVGLRVDARDRIQHSLFRRACATAYGRAAAFATPAAWPSGGRAIGSSSRS